MFGLHTTINNLIRKFEDFSPSSKVALVLTLLIFAAIPMTAIGLFEVRTFSSQAETGKPDHLSPQASISTDQPNFSWSCYNCTIRFRVYLREGSNQFGLKQYWYKDVVGNRTDWTGWKNSNYAPFPGFLNGKTYYWIVGCTPGYGSCNNSDSQSFLIKKITYHYLIGFLVSDILKK